MTAIYFDSTMSDDDRRNALFAGAIFVFSPRSSTGALCEHMRTMVEDAFAPWDPRWVHNELSVEACVDILVRLKPTFIHHPTTKKLVQDVLAEFGCDDQAYFDVPRMRTAYPSDYLSAGIAYAFHPHRDTWYSAPQSQLNWWLPVYDLLPDNTMTFYPRYFDVPVANDSEIYNYYRWNAEGRASAARHVKTDSRPQPKPQESLKAEPQVRLLCPVGGLILFSGAQLHATVENTTGTTRYSMDFRTVHLADLRHRRGAANIDSRCTGTSLRDFVACRDLSEIPEAIVAMYDDKTADDGEAVLRYTHARNG